MHQVQLADQLHEQAQRRASETDFTSVNEYIAKVFTQDLSDEAEDIDQRFTPERLGRQQK